MRLRPLASLVSLAMLSSAAVGGCVHDASQLRFQSAGAFRANGPDPAQEYARELEQPPPTVQVVLLENALPPGVNLHDGMVNVEPEAGLEYLGTFQQSFWIWNAPKRSALEPELRRVAKAAGADVLAIRVHPGNDDPARVLLVEGFAFRRKKSDAGQPVAPAAGGIEL